ncbi:lectin-like domain-containing protein [Fructobacillus americanaquae]|uniref:KxYKxGKxW signal peptide domain-containing protein n=1 Tax=Fructobacillus americanaquae TaxID=2940302 RepID=A0ABY5BYN9_9LACO|nr:KxYKxGKxW signal peptide domain-containing protein [Fructobacillus americanaquae]USS91626.1 KxYKxGKxW signal peptide domain-containing protein [Fructobacillus americanaquae]
MDYEQQTYKLYKAKKLWVTALAGARMFAIAGVHQQAQADDVSSSQTATKSVDTENTSDSTAQQSQTASSQVESTASTDSQSAVAQGLNPQSTTSQNTVSQSASIQENTNNNDTSATGSGQGQDTSSATSESTTQSQTQQEGSTAASNSSQSSQTQSTLDFRDASDAALGTSQPVTDDNLSVTVTKNNFLQWFKLNGSATYDADTNTTTLTTDQGELKGNISLNTRINANDAFELHGTINLGSKLQNYAGADGIGIAFHHWD